MKTRTWAIFLILALGCGGGDSSDSSGATPDGEVVWQMRLVGYDESMSPGFIYKAQRVGS